jgi:hypothetical protein
MSILAAILLSGCGSTKFSHTPRTATEQLLLTSAWDLALTQVDFEPLRGKTVFLDTKYVPDLDKGWLIASVREALARQGALLAAKEDAAQLLCEVRVGAYGTDSNDWMVGIPQITIPVSTVGLPTGTVPEVPFIKKNHQKAAAKLALTAYDRATGRYVWESGTLLAWADAKNLYVGSLGPIQSGTIYERPEIYGFQLPTLGPTPTPQSPAPPKPTPQQQPATEPEPKRP